MNCIKEGWFSEVNDLWPGSSFSLEVKEILHSEKTEFQDILVVQTKSHGKALILDGIIQCTESDEFAYQEMIALLPICSHPDPKSVLIIGGGDGGVAREVCKLPFVEKVTQVEIDAGVIEVCKKYIPTMGSGLMHPKLSLKVEDGFKFMEQNQSQFDVIITDSSDPVGPAISLFQKKYFELMKSALKPGGIVCSQAGTIWANMDIVSNTYKICMEVFEQAAYGWASVPTYPTGQIGFVLGSLNKETNFKEPLRILTEEDMINLELRYYSPEIHRAAFVLPRFAKSALSE